MTQPPLYKYLDVRGAKLTLGNGTFKHAKPSDFNDTEDLTIQSIFPEDVEAALTKLANCFTDVIVINGKWNSINFQVRQQPRIIKSSMLSTRHHPVPANVIQSIGIKLTGNYRGVNIGWYLTYEQFGDFCSKFFASAP